MSINVGSAIAYLDLDTSRFESGMRSAKSSLQEFTDTTNSLSGRIDSLGKGFQSVGNTLNKSLTLPITLAGTGMVKAATDFESAFAGVRKTVNATEQEYEMLSDAIKKMATETASSSIEIAGVMEVAGQLGVEVGEAGKNIEEFTRVMVQLGDSTNLSAEEAATALARFMNIMGTSNKEVSNLGSTIVALGNNFATTESEIVEMATRLASASKMVGLTETEVLALATAMSSVGIQAEAGGTAMTQTLNALETAVEEYKLGTDAGIENLTAFAQVAGTTAEEFSEMWQRKPLEALQAFIQGVAALNERGESATLILDELGLSGIRQSNTIRALSLACDMMADSINTSNMAWQENTALANEAEQRYGTTASQLSQLKESFRNLAIEFGELMLPYLQQLVDILRDLIQWFTNLDEEQKKVIITVAAVVAAIGPLLTILGKAISIIASVTQIIAAVGPVISSVTKVGGILFSGIKAVVTFIGGTLIPAITSISAPVLAVIAVIGALIAAGVALYKNWDEVSQWAEKTWNAIKDSVGRAIDAIGNFFSELGQAILGVVENVSNWLSNLWGSIVDFFSNILSSIGNWLNNIWGHVDSFLNTLLSIGSKLVDFFAGILSQVGEFFTNLFSSITESISNILNAITEWGSNLINKAVEIGRNFVDSFVETFHNLASKISEFIGEVIDLIVSWGRNLVDKAKEIGRNFFNGIVSNVKKVGNFFADVFDDIIGTITNLLPKMVQAGADIISNLWDGMKRVFTSLADWVSSSLSNLFKPISNMVSKVVDPLKGAFNKVTSWFSGSHANGLDYVPYNGYVAELHQGEKVLTKDQAEMYNKNERSGDTYNFYSPKAIDEYEATRLMKRAKKEQELLV